MSPEPNRDRRANGIDFALASALAAETLPAWAPALLGRHVISFKPGEVAWWPNCCDGVIMFAGPPVTYVGDWLGRWRHGDRWGRDVVELVAAARGCRPGQAPAFVARAAGVPLEALFSEGRAA